MVDFSKIKPPGEPANNGQIDRKKILPDAPDVITDPFAGYVSQQIGEVLKDCRSRGIPQHVISKQLFEWLRLEMQEYRTGRRSPYKDRLYDIRDVEAHREQCEHFRHYLLMDIGHCDLFLNATPERQDWLMGKKPTEDSDHQE